MVVRIDDSGRLVEDGDQVEIGGNDKYLSKAESIGKARLGDAANHHGHNENSGQALFILS